MHPAAVCKATPFNGSARNPLFTSHQYDVYYQQVVCNKILLFRH